LVCAATASIKNCALNLSSEAKVSCAWSGAKANFAPHQ